MARGDYSNDGERVSSFPAGRIEVFGNLTADPRKLGGSTTTAAFTVAANFVNSRGYKGTHFYSVTCWRGYAEYALAELKKGTRVCVRGDLYGHEWENDKGDLVKEADINADFVSHDPRWYGSDNDRGSSSGGGRSRGRDDDEGERRPRSRSRDEDEPRARRGRDEDDAPRGRSRSRDEDEDAPRARSRERVERDDAGDEGGEERPRRRRASRVSAHGDGEDD